MTTVIVLVFIIMLSKIICVWRRANMLCVMFAFSFAPILFRKCFLRIFLCPFLSGPFHIAKRTHTHTPNRKQKPYSILFNNNLLRTKWKLSLNHFCWPVLNLILKPFFQFVAFLPRIDRSMFFFPWYIYCWRLFVWVHSTIIILLLCIFIALFLPLRFFLLVSVPCQSIRFVWLLSPSWQFIVVRLSNALHIQWWWPIHNHMEMHISMRAVAKHCKSLHPSRAIFRAFDAMGMQLMCWEDVFLRTLSLNYAIWTKLKKIQSTHTYNGIVNSFKTNF